METIDDSAFNNCTELNSIKLPKSITSVRFYGYCKKLLTISIPIKVTMLGAYSFNECINLNSVILSDGITVIGDAVFFNCRSLATINIPSTVTSIGYGAFEGNNSLVSITIPFGVSEIKMSTFSACTSLTSVALAGSVTSVGDGAFYNCNKVRSFTVFNPEAPSATDRSFEKMDFVNCQLNVPIGSKDKYVIATGWKQFNNIVEFNNTGIVQFRNTAHKVLL